MSVESLVLQALNGLTFGSLLFLVASGFTLVFGLMRIVNLAHGGLFLLGGYTGIVVFSATRNLPAAMLAGALVAGAIGLLSERLLLVRVRGQELPEVLVTVGIAFVIADLSLAVFGGNPRSIQPPPPLTGSVSLGGIAYPTYRLVVLALALVVGAGLLYIQRFTKVGALIRAGVDDREIAGAMGIDIDRVFAGMFVAGSALAGLAGVVGAGALTIRPGADLDVLLFALVVVIVGGLGSVGGAAVGSIFIGLIDAFSKLWLPELSYFAVFLPMAVVLIVRPQGLLGRPT
ncbi:MAG TPA: branched-chain amino acid ABC transporter permease [Candidatus Limnocylindrales bacterium]|nr:branched-chain amino acid ABC transporter permease [Candidatus Limnocylindrales bacterium]